MKRENGDKACVGGETELGCRCKYARGEADAASKFNRSGTGRGVRVAGWRWSALEIVGEKQGEALCAEPEGAAICCAVVKLREMELLCAEGVDKDGDVLCFVGGAERGGHGDVGGGGEAEKRWGDAPRGGGELRAPAT